MAEDVFEIVGTVVGGAFNVEAVVAEGGFAVVYRAYHEAFHASVALKCLKVPTVRRSDQRAFLERFREEGEVMFRLSQSISSVVRPLHVDAFETAKGVFVPYMALEWLDGESLDVVVAQRRDQGLEPLSPKRVVRLLTPVARALQRAHNFPGKDGPISIVHRDLKPDNIIIATVNHEQVVKILDFGIAKVKSVATQVAGRQSQDSGASAVPFTPGYAAPEQWFPKRYGQSGPWTDIWGLALCAVEAMSGKPAIDGDHAAMMGTAVDETRRPSPANEGVHVDDHVERIFLRALSVDPRSRYHDVGSFWDALEEALGIPSTRALGGGGALGRDSRSDGPPALLTERAFASPPNTDPSTYAEPMLNRASGETTPESGPTPDLDISDLEFAGDLRQRTFPPPPSQKPLSEIDLAPQSGPISMAGVEGKSSALKHGTAVGLVPVEHGFTGPILDSKGKIHTEPSGIDLAVSPQDVRRASNAHMRAVRAPKPANLPIEGETAPKPKPPPSEGTESHLTLLQRIGISLVDLPTPVKRFAVPVGMAVVGILMAFAYYINASTGGGRWALGPVPLNWIAGLLAVAGTAMLLFRLFWPED
ncbi:MAG: serine/threonine protein kinase [Sorangium cellulosum]|nr:MAG: serine/threonine protein kinase [Sorangium cellulosum]